MQVHMCRYNNYSRFKSKEEKVPKIEREVDDLQDQVRRLQLDHDQLRADFRKAIQRIDSLESWRTRDYEARE